MKILVGYTGFVGSNLAKQYDFDGLYNSRNIEEAFGTSPDICFYAGIPAEKFLANLDPAKDRQIIDNAVRNIKKINPKKLVLISTIDVYKNPRGVDENTVPETDGLHAYGLNRFILERLAVETVGDCLTVRLPALFGCGLKKNFIYDMLNIIPFMLNIEKYGKLPPNIQEFYNLNDNGFYKLRELTPPEKTAAREFFDGTEFSAVNFTDSRAVFPFYNLERLRDDITVCLDNDLKLVNFAVEPICVAEIFRAARGGDFINETAVNPPHYDMKTAYYKLFGGKNGYICDKAEILREIKEFIENYGRQI